MAGPDLARAVSALSAAVAASGAVELLGPLTPHSNTALPSAAAMLDCFASLHSAYAQFSEPERAVVHALNLRPVFTSAWWADLISACSRQAMTEALASQTADLSLRLAVAATDLPKLTALLEQPSAGGLAGGLVLSLGDVKEPSGVLARISAAVDAVAVFVDVIGSLNGTAAAFRLTVIEDEADTKLVFNGPSVTLAAVKQVLATIAGQLASRHTMPADRQAAVIAQSLEDVSEIGGHPEAPRLRALVEHGVQRFLEAHCELPGLHARAAAPRTTVHGIEARHAEPTPEAINLMELIAEERRNLERTGQPDRRWTRTSRQSF